MRYSGESFAACIWSPPAILFITMLALVTSDTHGHMPIFERYAELLRDGPYAVGIIAGDILDDGFKPEELEDAIEGTDLDPDDFVPELAGADEEFSDYADRQMRSFFSASSPFMLTMANIERKVRAILARAGKPIYVVPGNHDLTSWATEGPVVNIDGRRKEYGPINLVGYRWTTLDRSERDQRRDLRRLRRLIDSNTVLVSHSPPYSIFDHEERESLGTLHYGSREIAKIVEKQRPSLFVCGHVHRQFGRQDDFINCAFPTRRQFVAVDLVRKTSEHVDSGIQAGFWE